MSLTPLCMAMAALVAIAGIAFQWQGEAAWPWWRVGAVVLLIGLGWEWWRARRYRLNASVEAAPLRLGQRETITITFKNDERRELRLEYAPDVPSAFDVDAAARAISVPPQGSCGETVEVRPLLLGETTWPTLPVRVRGTFGLGWWTKPTMLNAELLVVPDALARGAAMVGDAPQGAARRASAGGDDDLDHLRNYQPGDARHTIDWKATAKTSTLTTRVMHDDEHLAVMLVLDSGRGSRVRMDGMSQLGHYVNVCARFAEYAVANDDQVGLVSVAAEPLAMLAPARGAMAVRRIRAALSNLRPQAAETDLVSAALAVRQLARHRCLIILLTDLYGQSASGGLMRSIRLWVPKHLPVVAGLLSEEVEQLRTAPTDDWLAPYVSLAAADYRTNLRATASSLRRFGAYPLITRAATLEQQVLAQYRHLKAQRRV